MKKILIIPISILLLTACATVKTPSLQTEGSNSTQEIQKEIPLSGRQQQLGEARGEQLKCDKKDERKCTIEIAKKMKNIEIKNEFLWEYMYMLETQTKEDSIVCDEITKGSKDQASCYWILAMRLKDKSLCDKIMPYTSETKENEVTNIGNCKNEISYTYKDSKWKLTTGMPVHGDFGMSYEGKAAIKGWMEWGEYYNEKQIFFYISQEDKIKLPPSMQGYEAGRFMLVDKNGKNLESDLTKYTAKNPLTINVTKINVPGEGAITLTVDKLPE